MKYFTLIILFFISTTISAQDINQFDANGKRHGIWKKTFEGTNQVRYQGEFANGKETGLFKFYKLIKKESVLTATKQFNENDNTADVKFLSSRGKVISKGKMNGKLYVGEWMYYHNNSNKIMTRETYDNEGRLQGKRIVYYDNGQLAEVVNYEEGSIEGVSKWYSLKGVVLKEFVYKNNELHGIAKNYNGKGEILTEGSYKRGKKTGVWKYYEEGKLVKQKDFTYIPKYKKKQ
ncbi:toxin-antitoxin system YwqK family antitoxin [Flavobacteriaceae bacterium AH-315-B10]|nr:toxin-antitoxin system YwqK family antitoxin [Flavobacteriaceae bacterium AH-315-B10]